jgi:hypothetical protein
MRENDGPREVRRGKGEVMRWEGEVRCWEGLEFQDLVIPVTISVRHWRHPDYVGAAAQQIQPLILASLQEASREGWRADEPTDFATLFSRAQVRTKDSFMRWRVPSRTIRLYTRQQIGPSGVTW